MYSVKIVCRHRVVRRGGGMGVCIKRSTMQARFFCSYFAIRAGKSSGRPAIGNRKPAAERRTGPGSPSPRPPRRFSSAGFGGRGDRTRQPEQEEETNKDHMSQITNLYWISREMRIKIQQYSSKGNRVCCHLSCCFIFLHFP